MARKTKRLRPFQVPGCESWDRLTDGTIHLCFRSVATYRIEWSDWIPKKKVRGEWEYELRDRQEYVCDRHLPMLLERADTAVARAHAPYRFPRPPIEVTDPTMISLEFRLDKRADAHGKTLYIPIETPVTGPVALALF